MSDERDTMYFVAILLGKANHSQGVLGNEALTINCIEGDKYEIYGHGDAFTGTLQEIEAWLDGFLTARGELP